MERCHSVRPPVLSECYELTSCESPLGCTSFSSLLPLIINYLYKSSSSCGILILRIINKRGDCNNVYSGKHEEAPEWNASSILSRNLWSLPLWVDMSKYRLDSRPRIVSPTRHHHSFPTTLLRRICTITSDHLHIGDNNEKDGIRQQWYNSRTDGAIKRAVLLDPIHCSRQSSQVAVNSTHPKPPVLLEYHTTTRKRL